MAHYNWAIVQHELLSPAEIAESEQRAEQLVAGIRLQPKGTDVQNGEVPRECYRTGRLP